MASGPSIRYRGSRYTVGSRFQECLLTYFAPGLPISYNTNDLLAVRQLVDPLHPDAQSTYLTRVHRFLRSFPEEQLELESFRVPPM